MLDIGWPELMVIGVLTVIVVGPKELPRVLRSVMGVVRKIRMMAGDFQSSVEDIARDADLADIKKDIEKSHKETMSGKLEDLIDPEGEIDKTMKDMDDDVKKVKSDSVAAANSSDK